MTMTGTSLAAAAALLAAGLPAGQSADQRRTESSEVLRGLREGRLLPLKEIERRVIPAMRGWQYIGVDFDAASGIYTLKFLRDGVVAWVEVDGRSGQVLGKSGN